MRPEEIEVGQTYRVRITTRDNPAQYLTGDPARSALDLSLFALSLSEGSEFEFTVTGTGHDMGGEPAVTGVRITESARVRTPLPAELAARMGLPDSVRYVVDGVVRDGATGALVNLPHDETLTIPVRWLR
ncbi:hypothetical protein D5S17_24250 [Pseudonocardiaceae bacterium YIM PH 21723]|nr:hypothetical protein D5S17_24250 [Pseudonocardiaceae bacterium YIM PH 21723]